MIFNKTNKNFNLLKNLFLIFFIVSIVVINTGDVRGEDTFDYQIKLLKGNLNVHYAYAGYNSSDTYGAFVQEKKTNANRDARGVSYGDNYESAKILYLEVSKSYDKLITYLNNIQNSEESNLSYYMIVLDNYYNFLLEYPKYLASYNKVIEAYDLELNSISQSSYYEVSLSNNESASSFRNGRKRIEGNLKANLINLNVKILETNFRIANDTIKFYRINKSILILDDSINELMYVYSLFFFFISTT